MIPLKWNVMSLRRHAARNVPKRDRIALIPVKLLRLIHHFIAVCTTRQLACNCRPYNQQAEGTRMDGKRVSKTDDVAITDLTKLLQEAPRQIWPVKEQQAEHVASYRLALGNETIQLGIVEFRILLFLAGRPYHAFTRRNIADAVS